MAYKLTLGKGDKVIVFIKGEWIEGEVRESQRYEYFGSHHKDNWLSVQADRYRMILFIGDTHFKKNSEHNHTVIKKVS